MYNQKKKGSLKMKKIFNLLASVTLVTSAASGAVSCGSTHTVTKQPASLIKRPGSFIEHHPDTINVFNPNASIGVNVNVNQVKSINQIIYAATNNNGLYQSTDGRNFEQNKTIPRGTGISQVISLNQIIYVLTFGDGLYQSTDGKTFTHNATIPLYANVQQIRLLNAQTYLGTKNNGLYQSTDGQTFTRNATIPASVGVSHLLVFQQNTYLLATTTSGLTQVYQATDGNYFVLNKTITADQQIDLMKVVQNVLYLGTSNDGLYQSTDGKTFTHSLSIPQNADISQLNGSNNVIYVGTRGNYATNFGLYESTDNGKTFHHYELTDLNDYDVIDQIKVLDGVVYVLTSGNRIFGESVWSSTLFYSTDNGKTFGSNQIGYGSEYKSLINQFFAVNNKLYAATSQSLWQTNNVRQKFVRSAIAQTAGMVQTMVMINNIVYVGTTNGLYEEII